MPKLDKLSQSYNPHFDLNEYKSCVQVDPHIQSNLLNLPGASISTRTSHARPPHTLGRTWVARAPLVLLCVRFVSGGKTFTRLSSPVCSAGRDASSTNDECCGNFPLENGLFATVVCVMWCVYLAFCMHEHKKRPIRILLFPCKYSLLHIRAHTHIHTIALSFGMLLFHYYLCLVSTFYV